MLRALRQSLSRWLDGSAVQSTGSGRPFTLPVLPAGPPMPLVVEAWHGGGTLFERFSLAPVGSGEGAHALGWGLYFSEDRRLGEYNAAKRRSDGQGPGALYRVMLHLDRHRIINLDCPRSPSEQEIGQCYGRLRSEMGDRAAAHWLQRIGVQAVQAYEQELAATGDTIVCLADDIIEIQARYRLAGPADWQAV